MDHLKFTFTPLLFKDTENIHNPLFQSHKTNCALGKESSRCHPDHITGKAHEPQLLYRDLNKLRNVHANFIPKKKKERQHH